MCNYCKLETLIEEIGERAAHQRIAQVKDGHQISALYLHRYIVEEDNIYRSSLIVEVAVELSDGIHMIKEEEIPIKYCPFCGEEL